MSSTDRDEDTDPGRMHVLSEPLMVIACALLVIKAIRHPRRALRRAREIVRETKQDSVD